MKIAVLTPTFHSHSGIDRVVEDQVEELTIHGTNEVTVFALSANFASSCANLEVLGMPKSYPWQRVYRLLLPLDLRRTLILVRKLKAYELVISHLYPMNWPAYLAKRFWGSRFIYYNHGVASPALFASASERLYMRLFDSLTGRTIQEVDGAISVSNFLRDEMMKKTGIASHVLYNRVSLTRFRPDLPQKTIRARYDLPNEPIIFYVGRVTPPKGVHLLVQAIALVRREFPSAHLIIGGKHTWSEYSLRLQQNEAVLFSGFVPDEELPLYYAACDVYATATLWEGFNRPIVEAQACGRPVVAFRVGPHPEVVQDGSSGLLVRPGDVTMLAEGIVHALRNAADMGKAASEWAHKFGQATLEQRHQTLMTYLLDGKHTT